MTETHPMTSMILARRPNSETVRVHEASRGSDIRHNERK